MVVASLAGAVMAQSKDGAIAKVGRLEVKESEFLQRLDVALNNYEQRTGEPVPDAFEPMLRRHVLEGLIRAELLMLEAERRGLLVSDAEAEEALKRNPYFNEGGTFNEARFEAVRLTNPDAFKQALDETRLQVSGSRLSQQIDREFSPDLAELRRELERDLTSVDMDALVLPYSDFSGQFEEPTESEILDYYRGNPDEFMRPAHAVITAVSIQAPTLPDSLREVPARVREHEQELRDKAEAALESARAGQAIDEIVDGGEIYRNVEVRRDNFPGFWRGDARSVAAVFSGNSGNWLDTPVRGREGWLIVRVDESSQDERAPLVDVAPQIRAMLRQQRRDAADEREMRALYRQMGDSLATDAASVRYAVFRAENADVGRPSKADIERYYRAHVADYSKFDAARGEISTIPIEEVQDEIVRKVTAEARLTRARSDAEKLLGTWERGKRDGKLESRAEVVERGPVPIGNPLDDTAIGRVLGDSLAARDGREGVGTQLTPDGMIVFQIHDRKSSYLPPFEEATLALRSRLEKLRETELAAEARAIFDENPAMFALDDVIHMSRVVVPMREIMTVPLSREEVEKWHREHIDKYSAPEVVAAKHILIAPSGPGPGPDQAARIKAQGILARIKAGESFEDLAREFSDDFATRDAGGDLGSFGRGVMVPAFERVVFSMRAGDLSDLVRTPLGYHIIKCTAYDPMVAPPLPTVYSNVSADAAKEKAIALTRWRADSLFREMDSIEEAKEIARANGLGILRNQRVKGSGFGAVDMSVYFQTIDELKPGEFYPGVQELRGAGFVITWIDSISPPRAPTWQEARDRAIAEARRRRSKAALDRKIAELRRLESRGWSLDSLGTLFGGLVRMEEARVGDGLPQVGGVAVLDSLVFGTPGHPPLEEGAVTDWVPFPGGAARVRLVSRLAPPDAQLAARVERERRREVERQLFRYYEELKKRHRVEIYDRELRSLTLSPPPPRDQES